MKLFLCAVVFASFYATPSFSQNNPETQPESDVSAGTKKVLRNIGRKSMDSTCELTKSKIECDKEKAQHEIEANKDQADAEARDAKNEHEQKMKEKKKKIRKEIQKIEEENCHNEKGKIPCAGEKVKNSVKNAVD